MEIIHRSISVKLLFMLCLTLSPSYVLAKFKCSRIISKMESCNAPYEFTHIYEKFCTAGSEISENDIISTFKYFDKVVADNPCLQRVYVPPRMDRKARNEYRKNKRREEVEEREEKRLERNKE